MKKILMILGAIIGIGIVVWLLSYVIGFLWELFWVVIVLLGIVYVVKKFR